MSQQGTQAAQEQKQQPQPLSTPMAEAGFAMNVRMLDEHGQEVQLTFRCPLASQSAKLIDHYKNQVKQLLDAGWQPSKPGARGTAQPSADSGGAVPVCRVHGAPMKPSRKPGSFFCSKKLADGSYCQEKGGQG